ncbi:hypothetical protein I8751_20560 [Nostocaceae cyanobacterium CENA357]|uniref:Uncharacterized protein n=1 Tax=Atlanticothrix silvestris CENA357 TaxID=1725252 RepID=A0A8J7L725_9CYAN|nr:hypothetical protein [Atlanticothrix silvestris]MBH8554707.1 hypothetical protein [Atlanticothrix silvestris CENA357]
MSFIKIGINLSSNFINSLPLLFYPVNRLSKKHKTHDYSQLIWGKDYVFESLSSGIEGQMTGIGKGIKPRDYIILQRGFETYRYRVEQIDYYSDPSDMWIALLKRESVS